MAVVYKHTRLDTNEIFYIGIGKTEKRAYSKCNRNKHWHNIVNKVGYKVEILETNISWLDACNKEIELIALYGRSDLKQGELCNLTDGGEGSLGLIVSDETKLKQSIAHKGIAFSEERVNNMRGKPSNKKGIILSDEIKLKISNSLTGKTLSDETKLKLSIALKGKIKTDDAKMKMSNSKKGHSVSEETRRKISDTLKNKSNLKIYQYGKI